MKVTTIATTIFLVITISMVLSNRLLGQIKIDNSTKSNQLNMAHKEEWEVYIDNDGDDLASYLVDIGLHSVAPIKSKSHIVWITLTMNNPRKDGLSSQEESGLLNEIEDALFGKITSKYNSIYVGRLASEGERHLYFYFEDTTLYDKTIEEAMIAFPKYKFEFGTKQDATWTYYFEFLYPRPHHIQTIQNRRVVQQLEKGGDKLTKSREVFHWIYFKSDEDREKFIDKIKNDNFLVVEKDYDKTWGEFSYKLQIKRVDKVDLNSVNEYVIYLWELANELNAEYDGWETSIETE
jgi:uncharacterized protein (TIGR01619 family)